MWLAFASFASETRLRENVTLLEGSRMVPRECSGWSGGWEGLPGSGGTPEGSGRGAPLRIGVSGGC